MIPFIRSLSELMAITESRDKKHYVSKSDEEVLSSVDSAQRKRYIKTFVNKEVDLPNLPKIIRRKWIRNKDNVSRFLNDLDYNIQIQSSYDLTLLERQNKRNQKDIA